LWRLLLLKHIVITTIVITTTLHRTGIDMLSGNAAMHPRQRSFITRQVVRAVTFAVVGQRSKFLAAQYAISG
jgi:hypothetical protein